MKRICYTTFIATSLCQILISKPIALFYALDNDWRQFASSADSVPKQVKIGGSNAEKVKIGDFEIYGLKMGSGPVNTAASSQSLISSTPIEFAISIGPVGSLSNDLPVGSTVLIEQVIPWQTVPDISVASPQSFTHYTPINMPGDWSSLLKGYTPAKAASGEQFINQSSLRSDIHTATDADVVEMNLYGLLVVLQNQNIPSLHPRIVSDLANEDANDEFVSFRSTYNGSLGKLIADILKAPPSDPTDPDSYPELKQLFQGKN
ncbi:hypothetical protein [Cerasicoccus maritimus]|uniref:5'-methylthioadenosine/S-adenosylhomocysteine nucleosidase family protein n=1 Tax=Cerasicoccus maritimus TaxID=490089 RepID=UPI00285270BE|nr:hypothetical protein [Cerasicoccus maritimus]